MQAFWALKWTSRLLGVFKTLWDALGIIRIQWEKSMEKSMGKINGKNQWDRPDQPSTRGRLIGGHVFGRPKNQRKNQWEKSREKIKGKINGKNQWEKSREKIKGKIKGKINGKNQGKKSRARPARFFRPAKTWPDQSSTRVLPLPRDPVSRCFKVF